MSYLNGANYLVIGRQVTRAEDPRAEVHCRLNHLKSTAFKNNFAVCVPENIKQKIMTSCQRCVKHLSTMSIRNR